MYPFDTIAQLLPARRLCLFVFAMLLFKGLFSLESSPYSTHLHVNEISFSYERMGTKTRLEKEAKGNSEMAY